ncbi:DNA-binding protein [Phreatobacter cathodiphilus]|uniref:DNA-binding protein n=1 Tax=Phreatobacter cathodiphilus TaxID=1868589 RepID=A0A2S0N6M1_9HYPH|nr:DNA-binding protein [Phreatobacter cathodiphilus]
MAEAKYEDALLLLSHRRPSNAFYMAGYAVEIGFKACIALQFAAHSIPDRRFVSAVYTHSLKELVGLAGLTGEMKQRQVDDVQFAANWSVVVQWSEESRYRMIDELTASSMIDAVGNRNHGVLPWLKLHW